MILGDFGNLDAIRHLLPVNSDLEEIGYLPEEYTKLYSGES